MPVEVSDLAMNVSGHQNKDELFVRAGPFH